ncbi:MAG: sensor domain-containing diguanylate cyclase, partial [Sphaerochaeta sp.]|nr:sensor domain-containing diguanylate cyclase [Sphaerochaeta sp.]
NSYIWVNEVVNWEGGDDYAIRRIHPNLRDTVGTLLSTNMTDIRGNTPYKTELEGVKQNGELFFTYYFQKKDSKEISEKLTYAKLYKDYNWIVAMGIHLDDLSAYIDETNYQSSVVLRQTTPLFMFLVLGLFIFNSVLLMIIEKRKSKKDTQVLQLQANQDTLTGIGNRRYAESLVKDMFIQFKRDQKPVLLALFDIDYFKHINDTYGHDIGDRTLVQLCRSLEHVVCSTDSLFRLGGDEFLVVCSKTEEKDLERISTTLLETARAVDVSSEGASFSLTISVGISTFRESDENEQQALKRADKALYRAKMAGRDRCEIDW